MAGDAEITKGKHRKRKKPTHYFHDDQILVLGDSMLRGVNPMRNTKIRCLRGDTIEDLYHHVRRGHISDLLCKKIVCIHAGTNDLFTATVDEMVQDMKALIEEIRVWLPDALICFSEIISRPRDFDTTESKIQGFNSEIKMWSKIWEIRYIRTNSIFLYKKNPKKALFDADNLHPSEIGAERICQYLSKYLGIAREDMGIPKNIRTGSKSWITRKPKGGYKFWGARERKRILHKIPQNGPVYAVWTGKDIHRPRTEPKKKKRRTRKKLINNRLTNAKTPVPPAKSNTKLTVDERLAKKKERRRIQRLRKRHAMAKARAEVTTLGPHNTMDRRRVVWRNDENL